MFGLGVGEIAVILFIALIFIGPKKLPELARGLGKGIREFQNAARGLQESFKNPPIEDQVPEETHAQTTSEAPSEAVAQEASAAQTADDPKHSEEKQEEKKA